MVLMELKEEGSLSREAEMEKGVGLVTSIQHGPESPDRFMETT